MIRRRINNSFVENCLWQFNGFSLIVVWPRRKDGPELMIKNGRKKIRKCFSISLLTVLLSADYFKKSLFTLPNNSFGPSIRVRYKAGNLNVVLGFETFLILSLLLLDRFIRGKFLLSPYKIFDIFCHLKWTYLFDPEAILQENLSSLQDTCK